MLIETNWYLFRGILALTGDASTPNHEKRSANLVNHDRRQNEDGGNGAAGLDNVVRLPTDWLGSRDELVPIGRPDRTDDAEPDVAMPPAAEDFWGEASAAVQDALQAPPGHGDRLLRGPSDPDPAGALRARGGGSAQEAARGSRAIGRRHAAVAMGVIAGLALTLSIMTLGASHGPRRNRPGAGAQARAAETPESLAYLAASVKSVARGTERATRHAEISAEASLRARAHRVFARHVRTSRRHSHRAGGTGSDPTHQTFVSSPSSETTQPVAHSSSPSTSQSPADATGASVSHTPSPAAGAAASGPSGQVALIGAGTSPSG